MQALYPLGHAPGRLGTWGKRLDARGAGGHLAPREVVAMRRFIAAPQPVVGQPRGHVPHQPGRLQLADGRGRPRAGQVVEGGKRAAVRQPRRRLGDIGQPARAPVRHAEQPARRAAELGGDDRRVPRRGHLAALSGFASACWTDRHSLSYQGARPGLAAWAVLTGGWLRSTM